MISLLLIALIIVLDYSNGKEVSIRILYLIPISLTTWNAGLLWGILIAVISAASKIFVDFIQGATYSSLIFYAWEGIIVFGIFAVYVLILSKLRQALLTLAENNNQLKEANELKDEFLGIASHDLRNPLNNILNLGTIIEEEPELPAKEIEQIGRHIKNISLQMFKLIDNLLTSAAIGMGDFKINYEDVDIVQIVKSILNQYYKTAEKKRVKINFESDLTRLLVNTDGNLIIQVIDNLFSNAVKFSPMDKNITVRVHDNSNKDNCFLIEIQDEGPGFSGDDRLRLFSRFGKLSARPTGNESSTGLGLFIVKKYIDALNGRISCISEKGKGALFVLEIPITGSNYNKLEGLN